MLKNKTTIIALLLFIVVNTTFLWEGLPFSGDFLIFLVLFAVWGILGVIFLLKVVAFRSNRQYKAKREKLNIVILGGILLITYLYPLGIIKSSFFEPPSVMTVYSDGAIHCSTTINLIRDSTFVERSVCFGLSKNKGEYIIKGDTIKFNYNKKSSDGVKTTFGIIELNKTQDNTIGTFYYYRNLTDSIPNIMKIIKLDSNLLKQIRR